MTTRFEDPLSNKSKIAFPALPSMGPALDEMSNVRGISRSEILRRIVAAAILTDAPNSLDELSDDATGDLERLAGLWTI